MKTVNEKRACPICGKEYTGYPALSRKDSSTEICPDCGVREALEALGVSVQEQEEILETIHNSVGNQHEKNID